MKRKLLITKTTRNYDATRYLYTWKNSLCKNLLKDNFNKMSDQCDNGLEAMVE